MVVANSVAALAADRRDGDRKAVFGRCQLRGRDAPALPRRHWGRAAFDSSREARRARRRRALRRRGHRRRGRREGCRPSRSSCAGPRVDRAATAGAARRPAPEPASGARPAPIRQQRPRRAATAAGRAGTRSTPRSSPSTLFRLRRRRRRGPGRHRAARRCREGPTAWPRPQSHRAAARCLRGQQPRRPDRNRNRHTPGDRTMDPARRGAPRLRLDGVAAEASLSRYKRSGAGSLVYKAAATLLVTVDGATKRLRLTGDWARAA